MPASSYVNVMRTPNKAASFNKGTQVLCDLRARVNVLANIMYSGAVRAPSACVSNGSKAPHAAMLKKHDASLKQNRRKSSVNKRTFVGPDP